MSVELRPLQETGLQPSLSILVFDVSGRVFKNLFLSLWLVFWLSLVNLIFEEWVNLIFEEWVSVLMFSVLFYLHLT